MIKILFLLFVFSFAQISFASGNGAHCVAVIPSSASCENGHQNTTFGPLQNNQKACCVSAPASNCVANSTQPNLGQCKNFSGGGNGNSGGPTAVTACGPRDLNCN